MERAYSRYFVERLESGWYAFPRIPSFWIKHIEALIPGEGKWRSDARYFLVLNVYTMVLHPLLTVREIWNREEMLKSEQWGLLTQDVATIAKRSERIAERRGKRSISATSVAMALGQLAPNLKTTSLQIWGPRDLGSESS